MIKIGQQYFEIIEEYDHALMKNYLHRDIQIY